MAAAMVGKGEAPESGLAELPRDPRLPFDWTFACGGVSRCLHFEPSPQDVRQWRVYRNSEPCMCAGLERVWRAMQEEMVPVLGGEALALTLVFMCVDQGAGRLAASGRWRWFAHARSPTFAPNVLTSSRGQGWLRGLMPGARGRATDLRRGKASLRASWRRQN